MAVFPASFLTGALRLAVVDFLAGVVLRVVLRELEGRELLVWLLLVRTGARLAGALLAGAAENTILAPAGTAKPGMRGWGEVRMNLEE